MNYSHVSYAEGINALKKAQKILLVSHRRPDGDTLGAALGLHFFLKSIGKSTTLACIDSPSERFQFLPDIQKFQKTFTYEEYDLITVVDAGDSKMTGFHEIYPEFLSNKIPILNIDHHISNNMFGTWNIVDPASASATVIVYKLLSEMGADFNKEIGVCLLAGIYNDTGSFMHSNTSLEVFKIAFQLAKTGVNIPEISKNMFLRKKIRQLKLWGEILKRLNKNEKNVVSSVITLEEIHSTGATSDDTGGIIDLMNAVPDARFTILVAEDEKGFVKGSVRTQMVGVDVAEIASRFGGGGHKKAAGFRIPGRLKRSVSWKIA